MYSQNKYGLLEIEGELLGAGDWFEGDNGAEKVVDFDVVVEEEMIAADDGVELFGRKPVTYRKRVAIRPNCINHNKMPTWFQNTKRLTH